jgi:hypothetical protein
VAVRVVHHAADHAPQIRDLEIQIGEIDLSPRIAKSARRIPQHSVAIFEQLAGDVP